MDISDFELEDGAIILEPQSDFNTAIVGITEDHCHVIYDYNKLAEVSFNTSKPDANIEGITDEDLMMDAYQDVDMNIIGHLPYWPAEFRPIIMIPKEIFE